MDALGYPDDRFQNLPGRDGGQVVQEHEPDAPVAGIDLLIARS